MIKKYPYLKDIPFLNKIYEQHNKTIYSKVTVLDWNERRITDIEGQVLSGSLSVNGDSAVRRTANLSIKIKDRNELYQNAESLFSINKKVFLEIGIKNNIRHLSSSNYPSYSIIWFPFGTFIIQNSSLTHDVSGVSLSLSLGDKMCLLNGEAGGTIPASTNFESYDTLGPDGDLHTEAININEIIPELVHHFGNERLENIVVNDIPNKIKQVMQWRGDGPLYIWQDIGKARNSFFTMSEYNGSSFDPAVWAQYLITYGYDCGYTYVPFVFPGELTANAGDSVCTVLDKIKSTLGNYEYYYDVFGKFIFQEIKNYVNTSEARTVYQNLGNNGYLSYGYTTRLNTTVYDFKDSNMIISYGNNPQFNMIKNDFVVWGTRKTNNGQQWPCRYHLAIDKRPSTASDLTVDFPICFDTNVNDGIRRCYPLTVYQDLDGENSLKEQHPVGIVGEYYYIASEHKVYSWVTDINGYKNKLNNLLNAGVSSEESSQENKDEDTVNSGYVEMVLATYYGCGNEANFVVDAGSNWRNVLYFQDLKASVQGLETSYYWAEMYNEWPKIYDIEHDAWIDGVLDSPSSLDWWLDLIDNDAFLNQFSVENIGRRSYAKTESGCNCVFEPDIPDLLMINTSADESEIADSRSEMTARELKELGLNPIQVSEAVYSSVTVGGSYNSCYQNVRQLLTDYTNYNESISVTCIPIYHLEPNTRVSFNDPDAGINGDFIINSISFDLSHAGTMSISAKKVVEKI